ncbi:hypothetical protein JCM10213_006123 [Rhodosporidiobolus nylandii]
MTVGSMAVAEERPAVQSGDTGWEGLAEKAADVSELARLSTVRPAAADLAVDLMSALSLTDSPELVPPYPSLPRPTSFPPWTALDLPAPSSIMRGELGDNFLRGWPTPVNGRRVQLLSNGMIVKRGKKGVFVDEGDMAELARCAAPEVVPKAHGFYEIAGIGFLFTEFVEGVELDKAWDNLDAEQRSALLANISSTVSSFHAISLPHIGSSVGAPPRSFEFITPDSLPLSGALTSTAAFLEFVKAEWERKVAAGKKDRWQDCPDFLTILSDESFLACTSFTLQHCDLAERNVLVDPSSGALLAIVDWGEAAVLPPGFEYAALLFEKAQIDWHSWRGDNGGGKAMCERLMADASDEERRLGELHHGWLKAFLLKQ